MKAKSFILSAFLLTVASLFAKLLGAVYRIPLTNILGAEGIGLYQLVFPLYSLILVFTSLSVPNALAKLISRKIALKREYEVPKILSVALCFFALFSLVASLFVYFGADVISNFQGNLDAVKVYKVIAPSIFFVGILAVFRGYFQGYQNMSPTGLSLIIEQGAKLVFGIFFAYFMLPKGIEYGVLGAVFGVTLSEIIALVVIVFQYYLSKKNVKYDNQTVYLIKQEILQQTLLQKKLSFKQKFNDVIVYLKEILKTTIPITLSSMILPLVTFIDSFLIINLLVKSGFDTSIATDMYGILTGIVNSLINLPSVIALSIATCIIPSISTSFTNGNVMEVQEKAKISLKTVLYIAMPAFIIFLIASDEIVDFLYHNGLNNTELNESLLASNLLKIASISVIFITLIQTVTTILQAVDKSKIPLINLTIACAIKVVLTIVLVSIQSLNIFGALSASVVCFLIACFLNLFAMNKYLVIKFDFIKELLFPVLATILMGITLKITLDILSIYNIYLQLIFSLLISGGIYLVVLILSKSLDIRPIMSKMREKISNNLAKKR